MVGKNQIAKMISLDSYRITNAKINDQFTSKELHKQKQ